MEPGQLVSKIQKNEGGPFFTSSKVNSQWTIDLNIRVYIKNLLEENIVNYLWLCVRHWFLIYDTKISINKRKKR